MSLLRVPFFGLRLVWRVARRKCIADDRNHFERSSIYDMASPDAEDGAAGAPYGRCVFKQPTAAEALT
jgi:hypothetical protein